MAHSSLADIIKKVGSEQEGFGKDSKLQPNNEDLDRLFVNSNKKQRNLMSRLDHLYEITSHPFVIFLCFFVALAVFLVFRYLDVYNNGCVKIYSQIHRDAMKTMTYLGTVVVTWVVTKLLEGRKK